MRRHHIISILLLVAIASSSGSLQNAAGSSSEPAKERTRLFRSNSRPSSWGLNAERNHETMSNIEQATDEGFQGDTNIRHILPHTYMVLSKRSMGRYILATSSLFEECARVYCPEPLGSVLSRIDLRVVNGLILRRQSGLGSDRMNSSKTRQSRQSDIPVVPNVEEPSEDRLHNVQDKYKRISSSFIKRHKIGQGEETPESSIPVVGVKQYSSEHAVVTTVSGEPRLPLRTGESFAPQFTGLRGLWGHLEDDVELLCERDDPVPHRTSDTNSPHELGMSTGKAHALRIHGHPNHQAKKKSIFGSRKVESDNISSSGEQASTMVAISVEDQSRRRNLVDSADDNAISLVNKLRDAASTSP